MLGYGNQGRSQALNMRDQGCKNVIVGNREDESYEQAKKDGFPVYSMEEAARLAVAQDVSGKALEYAKALCKAIGATKKGTVEGNINDETYLDLMTELGVLPLVYKVFAEAFKLETEMGHSEEDVLMEAYFSKEMAFLWEQAAERGLFRQLCLHSHTAQYAQLKRFGEGDNSMIRAFLKESYESIRSGEFNKEWQAEQTEYDLEHLNALREKALQTDVTKAEDRLKARLK